MNPPDRFPFTRARLDSIPSPASGRALVWDDEVAGLCCRITPAGDKSLWFSKWAKSGQRWIRIGDHPGVSVKDARDRATAILAEIAAGGRPWEVRSKARADEKTTIGNLWESYLANHALPNKRPASVRMDCWLWARCIAPPFKARHLTTCPDHPAGEVDWNAKDERMEPKTAKKGKALAIVAGTKHTRKRFHCPTCEALVEARWTGGKLAADLTPEDARRMHDRITEERGATLANRAVVLLGTIYTKAAPNLANPAARSADFRHHETARDRHMSAVEVGWFWEGVNEEAEPWPLFFLIAATTGARKGNILSLPWPSETHRELNLATGRWLIPPHKAKGGEPVAIQLAPLVCDRLTAWRAACGSRVWVFPQSDDPERHAIDPGRAWDRVRWRMEARRLLVMLSGLEDWPAKRMDTEMDGLATLANQFWKAALGRRESTNQHPLERVLECLRDRVTAAGGEPRDGTVMDLRFHDIRRSVGAHMAMAGHSETEIGKLLGHAAGSKSTRIYGRIGTEHAAKMASLAAATMLSHNPRAAARVLNLPEPDAERPSRISGEKPHTTHTTPAHR